MSTFRLLIAIWLGKSLSFLMYLRGSRGTALPGLVVEKFFPSFLRLARPYLGKVIVVTGTNGKTSTQTLLAHSLRALQDGAVLVNSRGANLSRGLVAEICRSFSPVLARTYTYSVFEVEEATFPRIATMLEPDILLITNFFRDQLDAYGEINRTKQHVLSGAQKSGGVKIIANGDDPQVLELHNQLIGSSLTGRGGSVQYVSLEGAASSIRYEKSSAKLPKQSELKVTGYAPAVIADNLGCEFKYRGLEFKLALPGFYSYYAFAFTTSTLEELGLLNLANLKHYQQTIFDCKPAFGRGEIIKIGHDQQELELQLFLIKNPVGFDLALDLISELKSGLSLGILINDKIADGRDVSWLWDSQLEKLQNNEIKELIVGGERALDMALRLKYSGVAKQALVAGDTADFIAKLATAPKPLKVLATYTAMNQFRDSLFRRGKDE